MIKVLLVDDSASIRRLLTKAVSEQDDMEVCGAVEDGVHAIQAYRDFQPDIVIMDVEMPEMDGVTALREILDYDPRARVIMCSALTAAGGETTMRALESGAIDCLLKPSGDSIATGPEAFYKALVDKIRAGARRKKPIVADVTASSPDNAPAQDNLILRPIPPVFHKARLLAIGSSTGGVQALLTVLEGLGTSSPGLPIVITQHMPAGFTKTLATHIQDRTGLCAMEAEEGMRLENNTVYIAPGGFHLEIRRRDGELYAHLSDAPPENFCRPAVDVMLRSLLAAEVRQMMIVILTGMGSDGMLGAEQAVEQGHLLIAQDEESSIVWGMPGAVATAGLCHAVLPLDRIGPYLTNYF